MFYVKAFNESAISLKKIKSFKTDEGKFSTYDIDNNHPSRADMFTVQEGKKGWTIRNALLPMELRRQKIALNFYVYMNKLSCQKTGFPLYSTKPRVLSSGKVSKDFSDDAKGLWEYMVNIGIADRIENGLYVMKYDV